MLFFFLTGCMPLSDVPEMEQKFVQYQPQFIELSKLICALSDKTQQKIHLYQPGDYINYASVDTEPLQKIEQLLTDVGFDEFILQGPECSVSLTEWDRWFGGEGQVMYFSFNPTNKPPFIAEQHLLEKRDLTRPIHFAKELQNDWYIVYENEP
jgi:hypothetical protein